MTKASVDIFRDLEHRLLDPAVRTDPHRLGPLLHPEFLEIAVDGRTWTRDEVLAEFQAAPPAYAVTARDFSAEELADGLVLVTYRSAHVDGAGRLGRHAARTSLWQRTPAGWQLRFHQGTPSAEPVLDTP